MTEAIFEPFLFVNRAQKQIHVSYGKPYSSDNVNVIPLGLTRSLCRGEICCAHHVIAKFLPTWAAHMKHELKKDTSPLQSFVLSALLESPINVWFTHWLEFWTIEKEWWVSSQVILS